MAGRLTLSDPAAMIEHMFDNIETFCENVAIGMQLAAVTVKMLGEEQDVGRLTEAAESLERVRRATEAAVLMVVGELSRRGHERGEDGRLREVRGPVGEVAEMATDAVAMALGCTDHEAHRRTGLATRLGSDLGPLIRPLMEGGVPERMLHLVAAETEEASPEGVAAVVEHVLEPKRGTDIPRIEALDRHDLAQACRRVLDRTDPGWREGRAKVNRREHTDVQTYPGRLGTTELVACLPSEVAHVLMRSVEELARARQREDADLRIGPARALALTDLALRGVEVSTHVTLGLAVVRGPDEGGVSNGASEGGAEAPWVGGVEVPKFGWIPGSVVQRLTERLDARVTRALLDPDEGTVLETSVTGYVPPPSVRRLVQLRDTRCRMWGCERPATACDLDHATPWPAGETRGDNLSTLCRHHHRVKHAPGWTHSLDADGVTTWTSPGGTQRITWPTEHAPRERTQAEDAPSERALNRSEAVDDPTASETVEALAARFAEPPF